MARSIQNSENCRKEGHDSALTENATTAATVLDGIVAEFEAQTGLRGRRDAVRDRHLRSGAVPTLNAVLAAGVFVGVCVTHAAGAQPIAIETVLVGNPGNPGEQSRLANSDPTFYGAVEHVYSIGKYEVTAGQYTAFLNAVAATDTYGLYHTRMDYDADPSREGCNIKRHGSAGSFTYSVAPDWADRPVNYVSWADSVRFANWLHNGQPTGAQDVSTTEDGSYFINGITENNDTQLEDVVREPDATWVIPTDSEWYKAAYHKNDGVTGNYWNFPTSADGGVSNQLVDPDPGNNATFSVSGSLTIGAPYYRTEVGAHENSASLYGTFDQGGNVMEFTETVPEPDIRRMRGGSWQFAGSNMSVSAIDDVMHSSDQFNDLGFRVANVVEPGQQVPALNAPSVLALLLGIALVGTLALRTRALSVVSATPRRRPRG